MPDFTSALYLGIEHGSRQLAAWDRLTLGKPAVLESPPGALEVERTLASMVGCEQALLATSTLHVFLDLLPMLSRRDVALFVDDGLYPIGMWGVERAAALGTPVARFPRHDVKALWQAIASTKTKRPVVVADGFCVSCGTVLPLRSYLECVTARNGLLVIDDTQALGILGRSPAPTSPYGSGGGGSLSLADIRDPRVVVVCSLAKAFGAPVAMIAGSHHSIAQFGWQSATRVHCSPPSAASIAAAAHALSINAECGDALRWTLGRRVMRLRRGLGALTASAGLFPVQRVQLPARTDPLVVHGLMRERGVHTVLSRSGDRSASKDGGRATAISFVVTALHRDDEIDEALNVFTSAVRTTGRAACTSWGGGSGHGS